MVRMMPASVSAFSSPSNTLPRFGAIVPPSSEDRQRAKALSKQEPGGELDQVKVVRLTDDSDTRLPPPPSIPDDPPPSENRWTNFTRPFKAIFNHLGSIGRRNRKSNNSTPSQNNQSGQDDSQDSGRSPALWGVIGAGTTAAIVGSFIAWNSLTNNPPETQTSEPGPEQPTQPSTTSRPTETPPVASQPSEKVSQPLKAFITHPDSGDILVKQPNGDFAIMVPQGQGPTELQPTTTEVHPKHCNRDGSMIAEVKNATEQGLVGGYARIDKPNQALLRIPCGKGNQFEILPRPQAETRTSSTNRGGE